MAEKKTELLDYNVMVEDALRGVMREALGQVAEGGMPGEHHFYITFRTRYPGVDIPPVLMEQHPDDMTIVLQHQFWGLEVTDDGFEVTLSFNQVNQHLRIPYAAVASFADPSSKFGLQFEVDASLESPPQESDAPTPEEPPPPEGEMGKVVALDAFRKK